MLYIDPLRSPFVRDPQASLAEGTKEKAALQELEHYFIYTLLQEMRKTIGGFAGPAQSREASIFEELFDDALSGAAAHSGQFGLAAQIAAQLHAAELQTQLNPPTR